MLAPSSFGLRNLPGVIPLGKGRPQLQPSFLILPRAHCFALCHGLSLLALSVR